MFRTAFAIAALALSASAVASPIFQSNDFVDNRFDAIAPETMLMAVVYDGDGAATLGMQLDCGSGVEWLAIAGVPGDLQIYTYNYDLNGCYPTGKFGVRDTVANGSVDGLAFATFFKDVDGNSHIIKSSGDQVGQNVLGVWPLGFMSSTVEIDARAADVTTGHEVLRSIVPGTMLLDDGLYTYRNF